jgi:hypothetical protein
MECGRSQQIFLTFLQRPNLNGTDSHSEFRSGSSDMYKISLLKHKKLMFYSIL